VLSVSLGFINNLFIVDQSLYLCYSTKNLYNSFICSNEFIQIVIFSPCRKRNDKASHLLQYARSEKRHVAILTEVTTRIIHATCNLATICFTPKDIHVSICRIHERCVSRLRRIASTTVPSR